MNEPREPNEPCVEEENGKPGRLLKRGQVAELLSCSVGTVARIPPRSLPFYRFGTRLIRYRRRDVIRYMRSHASPKQLLMVFEK